MKFIWEPADVKPGVQYFKMNIGTAVTKKIGYLVGNGIEGKALYEITGEQIFGPFTKEELANILNKEGYAPIELSEYSLS